MLLKSISLFNHETRNLKLFNSDINNIIINKGLPPCIVLYFIVLEHIAVNVKG